MKGWLHTLSSIGLIALAAFTPYIQSAISAHPLVTSVLTGVWAIFGHLLPSPIVPLQGK